MLNLAGSAYDLGNVLFAVLQDAEHRRRSLSPEEAEERLLEHARRKLAEIEESYRESGGTPGYWDQLEREVLETAMPQYVAAAVEQNRLERSRYGVWRGGDPLSRVALGGAGLVLGGLLIAAPLPFVIENTSALVLAAAGFLYSDITRMVHDYRHTRRLNRLVAEAQRYQKDQRLHYVSAARLDEELRALDVGHDEEESPKGAPPRRHLEVEGERGTPPTGRRDRSRA